MQFYFVLLVRKLCSCLTPGPQKDLNFVSCLFIFLVYFLILVFIFIIDLMILLYTKHCTFTCVISFNQLVLFLIFHKLNEVPSYKPDT